MTAAPKAPDNFAAACERQAESCAALGSPFTARLCSLLPQALDSSTRTGERIFSWNGDIGPGGHSLPLRLCGALHHLVLSGSDDVLTGLWPPDGNWQELDDAAFVTALKAGFHRNDVAISDFIDSAPQTNEVRRSSVLLPALYILAARFPGLPIQLFETGASAGLNLLSDQFRLVAGNALLGDPDSPVPLQPEWRGDTPPADAKPEINSRRGCDLSPVDISNLAARDRLLSYLWPDQPERKINTEAAMAIAAEAGLPVPEKRDAADWLEAVLRDDGEGTVTVIQHTIAWQYFPENVKARGEAAIAARGSRATEASPLARIAMEADETGLPGARVSLTVWPNGRTHELGRADFHGRWIDWRNPDLRHFD